MNDPRYYVLDAAWNPVACADVEIWGRWFQTAHRTLAQDRDEAVDGTDVRVSTVFLGLDHSFGMGPPVLWETLVFGGPLDGEMERYTSKADALTGHQRMCARVARAARNSAGTPRREQE